MPDNLYIQPLSLVTSPQAVAGDAIRLAGGMAYAHLIAVTVTRDVRVVLIKLCDRLHNMRTLEHMDPDRQQKIARVTSEIYAPLAKRLGIERIARELEDLSMRYLQPVLYRRLNEHLERNRARYLATIEKTTASLEQALREAEIEALS